MADRLRPRVATQVLDNLHTRDAKAQLRDRSCDVMLGFVWPQGLTHTHTRSMCLLTLNVLGGGGIVSLASSSALLPAASSDCFDDMVVLRVGRIHVHSAAHGGAIGDSSIFDLAVNQIFDRSPRPSTTATLLRNKAPLANTPDCPLQ